MKTARLIVTLECQRKCPYCCNQYVMDRAIRINRNDRHKLEDFEAICVTGGEPLLNVERTRRIIDSIYPCGDPLIYLYTAFLPPATDLMEAKSMMYALDGITFTVHEQYDYPEWYQVEDLISHVQGTRRLRIAVDHFSMPITVGNPWESIQPLKIVKDDSCLRPDETLFLLED